MTDYIEFTLTRFGFNEVIESLEKLCELSKDYDEIERYICLKKNLNDQKNEYYAKQAEELRKEFGLD